MSQENQILNTRVSLREAARSRLIKLFAPIRNFYELNWFTFSVLHKGSKVALAGSLGATICGVTSVFAGAIDTVLSFGLALGGLIGVYITTSSGLMAIFRTPSVRLFVDDQISTIMSHINLSEDYLDHGYEITKLPVRSTLFSRTGTLLNEFVIRSPKVDEFIRSNDVLLIHDESKAKLIDEALHNRAAIFDLALRRKFYDSKHQYPRQVFYNGIKACLANDLYPVGQRPLRLFANSFYRTFLTTDFVYVGVESIDAHPEIVYSGSSGFPAVRRGSRYLLSNISNSVLSNHIGVSTIVLTKDRQLILWEQNTTVQHSQNRLAPTGSGSCDWVDWLNLPPDRRNITALITSAMEREFRKESHPLRDALMDPVIRTRIIGFFRWLRRGGKPEFIAISAVSKMSHELEPNPSEVSSPKHLKLMYPASSVSQLAKSVHEMLGEKRLSVPLWVLLKCLEEMLKRDISLLDSFSIEER